MEELAESITSKRSDVFFFVFFAKQDLRVFYPALSL